MKPFTLKKMGHLEWDIDIDAAGELVLSANGYALLAVSPEGAVRNFSDSHSELKLWLDTNCPFGRA